MIFRKQKQIEGHAGAIFTCFYHDSYLYTGSADKFVARWNLELGTQDNFSIRMEQSVYAICCTGNFLWVGQSDGSLYIFDVEKREEKHHYKQHVTAIFTLRFNQLKQQVYSADAEGNLSVWDANTCKLLIYLPFDCGKIRDIAVNHDGSLIALACQDGKVRILDTSFFNERQSWFAHQDGATSVLFHPDDQSILISGGKDAYLRTWEIEKEKVVKAIPAHNFAVYRILSVGDYLISVSRDKTVKIWSKELEIMERLDLKTGGHRHSVNDATLITQDVFATVSDDKRIILWERIQAK